MQYLIDDHIFDLGLLCQPKTCCILCKQYCANFALQISTAFPVSHHKKQLDREIFNLIKFLTGASVSSVRAVQITRYLLNKRYIIKERLTNTYSTKPYTFIIFFFFL